MRNPLKKNFQMPPDNGPVRTHIYFKPEWYNFFIQLATELAKLSLDQSGPVKGSESKKNVLRRKSDLPQVCLERRYSGHKNFFSLLEHWKHYRSTNQLQMAFPKVQNRSFRSSFSSILPLCSWLISQSTNINSAPPLILLFCSKYILHTSIKLNVFNSNISTFIKECNVCTTRKGNRKSRKTSSKEDILKLGAICGKLPVAIDCD